MMTESCTVRSAIADYILKYYFRLFGWNYPADTQSVKIAVKKGASAILMPVTCRRQLFDLSDEMATKIDIQFYSDARDAMLKAMME